MPKLRLISLHCTRTEDDTGPDEAYLEVRGQRRWGVVSMNDNDSADLSGVPLSPFTKRARIDLWDEDTGIPFDEDDHLGRTYARAADAGCGEIEHIFRGDGARYLLTYEVVTDEQ